MSRPYDHLDPADTPPPTSFLPVPDTSLHDQTRFGGPIRSSVEYDMTAFDGQHPDQQQYHGQPHTPAAGDYSGLNRPNLPFTSNNGAGIRDSYASIGSAPDSVPSPSLGGGGGSTAFITETPRAQGRFLVNEKNTFNISDGNDDGRGRRRFPKWIWPVSAAVVVGIVALAVVIPVVLSINKHKSSSSGSSSSPGSGGGGQGGGQGGGSGTNSVVQIGRDGSKVTKDDGSTFTYSNSFGGYWIVDPDNPFNDGARAQSWSPALNETFKYGIDSIRGVNLGGWLNTEPFITPALYEKYPGAVDEWTLSVAMAADQQSGGLKQLEDHYKTFITEEDFAQIAGAGLNFLRIPLPFWAIETIGDEPFLQHTCWQYFLKAISWARKYGLRINLDLHTAPGSQNGYNHSGKLGSINFLNGVMGIANSARMLDYIRTLTEFISQPQYSSVVPMFSIINEPVLKDIGDEELAAFYLQAHDMIRNITGRGEGYGPYIVIHDSFQGLPHWAGYMPGADRLVIDQHPYFSFGGVDDSPLPQQVFKPCKAWAADVNTSMSAFGMTVAGEWSNGFIDCGLFLNGVGHGSRYEGTFPPGIAASTRSCAPWDDYKSYTQETKDALKQFALSSMDALQNWFFWNWKINPSSKTNSIEAPLWSYKLGLDQGWMPTDPRAAVGVCAANGVNAPFIGGLKPSQTGAPEAMTVRVDPAWSSSYGVWPVTSINPPNIGLSATLLPTYTPTGTQITLPPPTMTGKSSNGKSIDPGSGWYNSKDQNRKYVPVQGCQYPDPWNALTTQIPTQLCPAQPTKRSYGHPLEARATPAPKI